MSESTVSHPPHYNNHPAGIECIDVVEAFNFNIGNAIKYLWRCGLKSNVAAVEDLQKAKWYVERELERLARTKATKDPRKAKWYVETIRTHMGRE